MVWKQRIITFRSMKGADTSNLEKICLVKLIQSLTLCTPPPLHKHGRGPKSQVKTAVQRPPRA